MACRTKMNCVVIGALAAVGTLVEATLANDNGVKQDAQVPQFVEKPGYLEFSGAMIVRPVQNNESQSQSARDLIMGNFIVTMYIDLNDEYVIQLPEGLGENEAARALMATGNFEYVQPDWICSPQVMPNDPGIDLQWYHTTMQSFEGWDVHTGNPTTVVGICDTGLRTSHEDIQQHRYEGYNAVQRVWENNGGNVQDINGHGSHTTGDAAANGNNARGVVGAGWSLGHRILRVSELSNGNAQFSTLTHAALTSAQSGDKCVNVSYGGATSPSARTTATTIKGLGGLLFWSAGNESVNISSPNRDADDLIVVGATNDTDGRASFSNYGNYVDFFAPGVDILSLSKNADNLYAYSSGTSMASPIAAGVGAMIFSNNPGVTPDQVEAMLKGTCNDIGAPGVDSVFGYGRVNLKNAMLATPPPLAFTMTATGVCPGRVTVTWENATPRSTVALIFAKNTGSFVIPFGPCQGTVLGLGRRSIQLVGTFPSGSNGSGSVSGNSQPAACRGWMQMHDLPGCNLTNVVRHP